MAAKREIKREPLSPARIHRAALALIGETGVEDLSMRKLASVLGVDAMSIYHHVANKQALLLGVFQAVLEEMPLADPESMHWKDALRELGKGFHVLARRYPGIFPYMLSSPYGTPREREIFQYIRKALTQAGLKEEDRVRTTTALYTYGIGMANVAPRGLSLRPLYGDPQQPVASGHGMSDEDAGFSIDLMLAGIEGLIH